MQYPKVSLTIFFALWKLVICLVAFTSPGPGYDTSTDLLFASAESSVYHALPSKSLIEIVLSKVVRWDAIYFTQIAHRGYKFEQEWAFGWGLTSILAVLSRGMLLETYPGFTDDQFNSFISDGSCKTCIC